MLSEWYTESEVQEMVSDMEDFREYINGLDCERQKEGTNYYRKKYVDMYVNR